MMHKSEGKVEEKNRRGPQRGASEPVAPFAPIHPSIDNAIRRRVHLGRIAEIRAALSFSFSSSPLPVPCPRSSSRLHPHLLPATNDRRKVYTPGMPPTGKVTHFPYAYYTAA